MKDQTHHVDRPIAFPTLHDFRDFFPEMGAAPQTHYREHMPDDGSSWGIGSYVWIYDSRKGRRTNNQAQRLPAFVIDYIKNNMIRVPYDQIYFEVVVWGDGRALVLARYKQILGQRYLAIIDAATIPDPEPAPEGVAP
jgi:hypothetical protein